MTSWEVALVGRAGRWMVAGLATTAAFAVTTWVSGVFLFTRLLPSPDVRWPAAFAIGAAAAAFTGLWGQSWATDGGRVSAEQLAPHKRREREARDQLRQYLGRQDRLPQMDETSALALGVHPAIDLPRSPESAAAPGAETDSPLDQDLPTFVDRDNGEAITDWMRQARRRGGFLVIVGDSSVGKTRLLYETARNALPDFAVLAPDLGDGDLVNSIAAATFPLPKLIVWLDELQRFLDGPYLTPGSIPIIATTVRHLLDAPTPVVVLGTMWLEHAARLRATEPDPHTPRQRSRYPRTADVLGDHRVHLKTLTSFSETEREAAAKLSSDDPRLAKALADSHYNVTEVLAGAPQLIARYEQASEEQQAVLNAAIDARRLGSQAPLTGTLLRAAARGYLCTLHPDDTWFPSALTELTRADRPQDRATAPLIPVLNEGKSEILGYTAADYLTQYANRERHYTRVPASTWDALTSHIRDPADAARLADSARNRLLYRYAIPLYRHAADAGDRDAADWLARLLEQRGDLDGAMQVLRARAGYGDGNATWRLAKLLARRGDLDELRIRADAGDGCAAEALAGLLEQRGDLDGATQVLRASADAGDGVAAFRLAELLARRGDVDGLRARADAGDGNAAWQLAELLAERGDRDEAAQMLDAATQIAQARGDWSSTLLAREPTLGGGVDGLRASADAGDRYAAWQLAELLGERGDVDGLRARADADDRYAAEALAGLLEQRGDLDGAMQVLRAGADVGDGVAAFRLANLLGERGDLDGLRARADAGDGNAAWQLAELLGERGDVDGLRARADAGDGYAADQLPRLLTRQGRGEEAEQLHRFGLTPDGSIASA
jgi:hypothetical protein